MFVAVLTFRARVGEEDAIVALHEDWQRTWRVRANGFVAGELLCAASDPLLFIEVAHFESEAAIHRLASDRDQGAWYRRLASLCEAEPIFTTCQVAWVGQ